MKEELGVGGRVRLLDETSIYVENDINDMHART